MGTETTTRSTGQRRSLAIALAWLMVAAVCLGFLRSASAFQIKYTPSGEIIQWTENVVPYAIDTNLPGVEPSAVKGAVNGSFGVWNAVPTAYLQLRYDGVLAGEREGYVSNGENHNIVRFEGDAFRYDQSVLAVTLLTYESDTGVLRDADIIVNIVEHEFTVDPTPGSGSHDIQNTVTHEAGHFVGLAHELEDTSATMFPVAASGETTKRTLAQDDMDGISYLYPTADTTAEPGSAPGPTQLPSSGPSSTHQESLPSHSVRLERVELGFNCSSAPTRRAPLHLVLPIIIGLVVFGRRRTRP